MISLAWQRQMLLDGELIVCWLIPSLFYLGHKLLFKALTNPAAVSRKCRNFVSTMCQLAMLAHSMAGVLYALCTALFHHSKLVGL